MKDREGDGYLKSSSVTFRMSRSLFRDMNFRGLWLILSFALVAMLGYWLARTTVPRKAPRAASAEIPEIPRKALMTDEEMPKFRRGERNPGNSNDDKAADAGALENQRVLVFKDQAALNRFLERAGERIRLMGRLDALNALRIGFSDYDNLLALLDGSEEQSFVFPVNVPDLPQGGVQPGAVALGNHLLKWLGISGDNSAWGKGVRIAILDTGVTSHSAFSGAIRTFNFVDLPADLSLQNGHGTAVASFILGNDSLTPGVAPGAEVYSYRIADDNGESNSYLLAQGIVAAADARVPLVVIAMGSSGDSALVRNAIAYAMERGVMIVAAAGNNGINQVSYPAANDGVIAVGAVDALGNHLEFSNSGNEIAISAPGYGLNAAWTDDRAASVSGTSFSAPIVGGLIAALMTEAGPGNLTAPQAWKLLTAYLNDGGAAGVDPELGAGMPDIGRVLTGTTSGVYDAALASQRILPPDEGNPYGQVEILVQNRGTETLVNTSVRVNVAGRDTVVNLTSIAPDAVRTIRVPVTQPPSDETSSFTIDSRVVLGGSLQDVKPSNDRRVEIYDPAGNPF
jgi:hypothetical protein